MMRLRMKWLTLAILLALDPGAMRARAAGVNLGWDACGPTAPMVRTFSCATSAGADTLVASFVAPTGITEFRALEIVVDVLIQSSQIPDWWHVFNAGTCRQGALSLTAAPAEPVDVGCADLWPASAEARIGAYFETPDFVHGISSARVVAVAFAAPEFQGPLEPDREYLAFRLAISHQSSSGVGACVGCNVPACLTLGSLKLVQPVGVGDWVLSDPDRRDVVMWQPGSLPEMCTVPVRNRTWGQIKSIWR